MIYRLLIFLLWPVFLIYTSKIALRDKSTRYFWQRLGFKLKKITPDNTPVIWIHCASVGEVNTYYPLHQALLKKYPDSYFIITTNTTTGAETIKRKQADRTQHIYLPIESGFAIRRFLKTFRPQQLLVMETEIWPLLYRRCEQQNIPISIINARLSHRTLNANSWIKSVYKSALNRVEKILCKSEQERENFKLLGASEDQLMVTGNLKFAKPGKQKNIEAIKLDNRRYCVAASTHNDEELQLAKIWKDLNTDRLLVIVPRHPNRSTQIQQQLKQLDIEFAVRSLTQHVTASTSVYLADTIGELNNFYLNAEFVFIGGSLIEHGGQNILEPARLGKATVCGPHMFNFTDELELLLSHDAAIQVQDTAQLKQVFQALLNNEEQTENLASRAHLVFTEQPDVIENYLSQLML